MKNISKIIAFVCISTVFIFSCTTNDYEEPNDGAGRAIGINSFNLGLSDEDVQVRVGNTISFTDLSIFASGRTWTFPEGAADILGNENDTSTDLQKFDAIFKVPGTFDVILAPVFDGPVSEELKTETTTFEVLPPIVANFTTDIPEVDGSLKLEAGNMVSFINTSSELESADWVIFNNTTNTIKGDTIRTINVENELFSSLGSYTVTLKAFTPTPFSQDIKSLDFEVIPSSQPVTLNPVIEENGDGEIILKYSRDLNATTLDPIANFTLMVDGAPATITTVALDPDNLANLVVTPAENIKNTQMATLAYNAVNLRSADAAVAPSLVETEVTLFNPNLIIKDPTFEEGPIQWGNPFGPNIAGVTRERVSPGNDSDFAMRVTAEGGNNLQIWLAESIDLKAGNKISMQFDYLLPADWAGNGQFNSRIFNGGAFSDAFRTFYGTCCGLIADGTWHTITIPFVGSAGAGTVVEEDFIGDLSLQILPGDSPAVEIFFDNFVIRHVEE